MQKLQELFQFLRNKRVVAVLALLTLAIILTILRGLHFGLEFTGGIRIPATLAESATAEIMEKELGLIKTKLNAFGLTQVIVRGIGDRQIYIEVPESDPEFIRHIENIITAEGKFEAIIDKRIALSGEHLLPGSITTFIERRRGIEWVVSFYVAREGGQQFADVAYGKANYPVYLYLDRVRDAILLASKEEFEKVEFMKEEIESAIREHTELNNITILYLEENWKEAVKNKTGIVVITSDRVAERWLAAQNISVKFVDTTAPTFERSRLGTLIVDKWPAIGLLSAPFLSESLATGQITQQFQITGPGVGKTDDERINDARLKADEIKGILTGGRLPIPLSLGSKILIPPVLGSVFLFYSIVGMVICYFVVMAIVLVRYRSISAIAPLGFISSVQMSTLFLLQGSLGTIDLSTIAGFFAVMGTSVDSQIIITDILARRRDEDPKRVIKDAFYIITRDAAVIFVAMLPLILSNIVEIIGFATALVLGLILNIFITTQTYSALVEIKKEK